mmetsp:Transcript_12561/g.19356  ORF Transcript_12561/g.19356 Transcript_12561/m.19356 type:complete len:105 (-) Transcript_12561:643-957(-)
MMKMSCYYSPHSSDSEGAHKHVNDILQEQEISDGEPFRDREDHPPAATSPSPEANTAADCTDHAPCCKETTYILYLFSLYLFYTTASISISIPAEELIRPRVER